MTFPCKWKDTEASRCRYGEIAGTIWGDWTILWEDSEADYQGHASFLAECDGRYSFYEWWYGSCPGCDGWESADLTDEQIAEEMKNTALWLDSKDELKQWLDMLTGPGPSNYSMERGGGLAMGIDWLSGGLLSRVNAVRALLDMPPIERKPDSK